ncbi:NlpC/P60 family protein [Streptomyces sp. Mg1]|uniref:C40 family peptidase n=1 Tax=Streptomyces sp. Mg1 TaxID=465541 RepID=UPI00017E85F5|nr:NlpC/P60 family protein [Streptomyces sp. Mg1]AKL71007.1 glycoside hydrolase [Streptomyces sp. Mg1]EDX22891.1 NLP/P60 [Streptomyces sp. Mg1]
MEAKRWLGVAVAGVVATPLALGIGVVMLVAALAEDDSKGRSVGMWPTAGSLRIGGPDGVPAEYAPLILAAATACDQGLPPAILAAQLWAESNFDPHAISRDSAGRPIAYGISQFIPDTWASQGVDGDGDGDKDIMDPKDAIPSQGRMMCGLLKTAKAHPEYSGSPIEKALAGYNAGWGRVEEFGGVPPASFAEGQTYNYVKAILAQSVKYTAAGGGGGAVDLPAGFELPPDTPPQVRTAVAWALRQKDSWYQLGGDCKDSHGSDPEHWCDCSSLMQQAYKVAGIDIPRVTFDQINLPIQVGLDSPKPGDLVFNAGSDGSAASPGHVAMYIGSGLLIEAPRTGVRTRIVPYSSWRNSTKYMTRVTGIRRVVSW